MNISDGVVEAYGRGYGPGIGLAFGGVTADVYPGYRGGDGGIVTVSGGDVIAHSDSGVAIGGGTGQDGSSGGHIRIGQGAKVIASGNFAVGPGATGWNSRCDLVDPNLGLEQLVVDGVLQLARGPICLGWSRPDPVKASGGNTGLMATRKR